MSGWLIAPVLAMVTAAALIVGARLRGGAPQLIGAAMLFGLAGYAWQGSPALPGHPAPTNRAARGVDTLFAHERLVWLETVGPDATQLDGADAFIRNGDADYAAGILRAGLMRSPEDMVLWIGLGNALQAQADGMVTPPARYAFDRAVALAPQHPAPSYFLGLAYVQMGDLEAAGSVWRELLARAPADAPWRAPIARRLALIDRMKKPT